MTATEKYKRAEALFNDRTKRELADMVVHREADLEDAKAESEHMRLKALAVMGELQEENKRLKADNAKLRELARLLLWGIDNDMPRYEKLAWTQKVNALVRELGVEVD